MTIRERIEWVCSRGALLSALLAPFAFGAANLWAWVPLCWLWLLLGIGATLARFPARSSEASLPIMPAGMLALHLLFAVQLAPLPARWLLELSPGSFAAHFLPVIEARAKAPLTASPEGTMQAWLFVAAAHALCLAVLGGKRADRNAMLRMVFMGLALAGGVFALEGLIQSKSEHPFWLYGIWVVPGAGSHEQGIFGPYYNRDHYSNVLAMAASVAGALLCARFLDEKRSVVSFLSGARSGANLGLSIALSLMIVASATAGSRGGLVSLGLGLAVAFAPLGAHRPRLLLGGILLVAVALFATGVPAAFLRLANSDFEESRLMVWRDAARLVTFYPIFGCGIGAFAPAYWPYQRVVRFEYWDHLHNEYGQWILETGIIGVVFLAWALRRTWVAAPALVRDLDIRPALAGLIATLAHGLVDASWHTTANGGLAAILFACVLTAVPSRDARRSSI